MSARVGTALATAGVLLCLAAGAPLVLGPLAPAAQGYAAAVFAGGDAPSWRPVAGLLLRGLGLLFGLSLAGVLLAAGVRRRFVLVDAGEGGGHTAAALGLAAFALGALALWPLGRPLLVGAGAPDGAAVARAAHALLWLAAASATLRAALMLRPADPDR